MGSLRLHAAGQCALWQRTGRQANKVPLVARSSASISMMLGAGGGSVRRATSTAALLWVLVLAAAAGSGSVCQAQLRRGYYAGACPNVESIVRGVVAKKIRQAPTTVGATVRLFFHDCFVEGCDASVMVASTANSTAEKDHPINLSLAGDGFDTVIRARAAVDAAPGCRGKVSCADILAMATRDAIALSGGPSYAVELGRLDGLRSTASSVNGKLPAPFFNLDQLNQMFAANGLSQADMVALSAGHTVGLAHCSTFAGRLRGADATLDAGYAAQLAAWCPARVDPRVAVAMDAVTPVTFDNQFFRNLQAGKGLLASDQVLHTDHRSRPTVDALARSPVAFERAFVDAITRMGRVGVKTTAAQGNVRRDCAVLG